MIASRMTKMKRQGGNANSDDNWNKTCGGPDSSFALPGADRSGRSGGASGGGSGGGGCVRAGGNVQ